MAASFHDRVLELREGWRRRRELRRLASGGERAAQEALLRELYGWAARAAADIRAVYGDELPVVLTPSTWEDGTEEFRLGLGGQCGLQMCLVEWAPGQWAVAAYVTGPGEPGPRRVGTPRRNAAWTRRRFEELILGLLAAYERERLAADEAASRR
ncbi:hypothetical protein HRbin29_02186 [bacterium HR29]|jgi:hypothetical protein|nr:hypothetical protein HRbin29_02186 [bacterium HR29]